MVITKQMIERVEAIISRGIDTNDYLGDEIIVIEGHVKNDNKAKIYTGTSRANPTKEGR